MPAKKLVQGHETIPLKLSTADRKFILGEVQLLDDDIERVMRDTPARLPLRLTLHELDDLSGCIAVAAEHCGNARKEQRLDALFVKVERVLEKFELAEETVLHGLGPSLELGPCPDSTSEFFEWMTEGLRQAVDSGVDDLPIKHFSMNRDQRKLLASSPGIPRPIQQKLLEKDTVLTWSEIAAVALALTKQLSHPDEETQVAVLSVIMYLVECLMQAANEAPPPAKKKRPAKSNRPTKRPTKNQSKGRAQGRAKVVTKSRSKAQPGQVFQFRVSLQHVQPVIWRRFQIHDGTLDQLHAHIQTAMGWTNSHLYVFEIGGRRFANPQLLDDNFDCEDATKTWLSEILPASGERFAFQYEYDLGDGWRHDVLFEGCPPPQAGAAYPLCLEGEKACPPEDVGGVPGFERFVEIMSDPRHKEYRSMSHWHGGKFTRDAFDPAAATRAMQQGLPAGRGM